MSRNYHPTFGCNKNITNQQISEMETMPSKPVAIGEERKRAHSAHQTMPRLLDSPLESSLRQQQTNGPAWSVSRGCCSDTKSFFLALRQLLILLAFITRLLQEPESNAASSACSLLPNRRADSAEKHQENEMMNGFHSERATADTFRLKHVPKLINVRSFFLRGNKCIRRPERFI